MYPHLTGALPQRVYSRLELEQFLTNQTAKKLRDQATHLGAVGVTNKAEAATYLTDFLWQRTALP